jgi:hypothetical protein
VWDVTQQQAPLMSFDVGAAVGDVAWAPYSSTVFAAVTDEGKVHVFDLAQNRQLPLCVQKVSWLTACSWAASLGGGCWGAKKTGAAGQPDAVCSYQQAVTATVA